MLKFKMVHKESETESRFTEHNAPLWLTSEDTIKGSTMDMRWFWKDHVLTLDIGESIDTDFHTITRI